jgi:hypothetical protein
MVAFFLASDIISSMNKEELKSYIELNPALVSKKETSIPGLFVLKYKKRVFYDNLWNNYLEECRGTIVDADFNLVSYPFQKIYNYGVESKAPVLNDDTPVWAYRKVNGFMVAITFDREKGLIISTTGSVDSPYVAMAKELIDIEKMTTELQMVPDFTFMFECVHPDDPHIIPEEPGMYLLGMRAKALGSTIIHTAMKPVAKHLGCYSVEYMRVTIGLLKELSKKVKHEGFVFYTDGGVAAKIKSPYYLVKKFVARNPRTDKLMRPDIKQSLDEEYYPLIDAIQANIVEYTAMGEQERLVWVRRFLEKE